VSSGAHTGRLGPASLNATPLRGLVQSGDTDEQVNDPAQCRHVAEKRGDEIELSRTYESPVQAADYEEYGGHYVELLHGSDLIND